jgi:hypothetical protein
VTSAKWGTDPIALWIKESLGDKHNKAWLIRELMDRCGINKDAAQANVVRWTIHGVVPEAENLAALEAILGSSAPLIEAEAYRDHEARLVVLERDQETLKRLAVAVGKDRQKLIAQVKELLRQTGG